MGIIYPYNLDSLGQTLGQSGVQLQREIQERNTWQPFDDEKYKELKKRVEAEKIKHDKMQKELEAIKKKVRFRLWLLVGHAMLAVILAFIFGYLFRH